MTSHCHLLPFRSYRKLLLKLWTSCVFEVEVGRGLGATYTVHLKLIRKLVVDFLFVLIEVFFR